MVAIKIIIFSIALIGTIFTLIKNTGKWASRIQQYYIRHDKNNLGSWEEPWILTLFKAMVIFAGFMFLVFVFSFLFGTVYS